MRVLLIVFFAGMIFGQSPKLPPDIDPQSNSRLPLIRRDQLNDDEKKIFDDVANTAPGRVSLYSPPIAESIRTLNSGLRATVLGSQMFEICALIAAANLTKTSNGQAIWPAQSGPGCRNRPSRRSNSTATLRTFQPKTP